MIPRLLDVFQHHETEADDGEVKVQRREQDGGALDPDPILRHRADGVNLPVELLRRRVLFSLLTPPHTKQFQYFTHFNTCN